MIKKLIQRQRSGARKKRGKIFIEKLSPKETDKILDLGCGDGSYLANIVKFRKNVFISDISPANLERGKEKYGFLNTVLLNEDAPLPFADKYFDIVFCNSVIEHVTVKKDDVFSIKSDSTFKKISIENQKKFADEIRRISKRYFVQTPYKYFPIESHTQLPFFIVFLPRKIQISAIKFFNLWWIKKTSPDWNLFTIKQMETLFPDAEIIFEKKFGLIKSLIAVKK